MSFEHTRVSAGSLPRYCSDFVEIGFRHSPESGFASAEPGGDGAAPVRVTIFQIKLVHTLVFWVLSLCVAYALFSAVADRITSWTWIAVGLLLIESVVLAASGWTCPLTILAERSGAPRGTVSDIFLPKWFADRIFPICGTLYAISLVLIALRVFL